jgi:hypothetical protein
MVVHSKSGHPDWYIEGLVERYQYLYDEFGREKSKSIMRLEVVLVTVIIGILAALAFNNVWGAALAFAAVILFEKNELRKRKYLLSVQMLLIEAEFPNVRENIAL